MWNDFWGFIWFVFWIFVFCAYLRVLFSIISDLFRDHTLNGWWKALWIIFLLFVPLLTALVYVIARGRGMAERDVRSMQRARAETDSYIRDVAGTASSPAAEIATAKTLLDSGAISQSEFDSVKRRVLS